MDAIADIEEALVAHWSLFGRWPEGALRDEGGLLRFETPIANVPYNGVIRTRLGDGADTDRAIGATLEGFAARGVHPIWFDHPSATPADLGLRLEAQGMRVAARIACMSLELGGWQAPPVSDGIEVREVAHDADVATYTDLTIRYWEISDRDRPLVARLHRHWGRAVGRRMLALLDGEPVGKGYLSLAGAPGVAAIFGMSVRPRARGRGVAAALTTALLRTARESGARRVVLHSTEMAVGLYRRAGFTDQCALTIYATSPLWGAGTGPTTARRRTAPAGT